MRAIATRLLESCLLAAAFAAGPVSAVTFDGANNGPIPDNDPAGRTMTFDVANVKGRLRTLSVTIEINHSFVGDLEMHLVSPSGLAKLVLLSRAGASRITADGMHANLAGVYTFSDTATADLWAKLKPLGTDDSLPPGSYRTTTAGRLLLSDVGGCSTHLNRAFGGLAGADLNGQWTLQIADRGPQDVGAVNIATLAIEVDDTLFAGGFEDLELRAAAPVSNTRGRCKNTQFDFTGSGLSSYVTAKPLNGDINPPLLWTVRDNTGGDDGALTHFEFGRSEDRAMDGDYDGDGISDAVVWTNSINAFLVRRSSRLADAPLVFRMGASENIALSGDYDGDGVTDPAMFEDNYPAVGPAVVRVALSRSGTLRTMTVGAISGYASGGVDSTGDGRADIAMQVVANNHPDVSRYDLYTSTGTLFDTFEFGSDNAYAVPGRHLGLTTGSLTVCDVKNDERVWRTRNLSTDAVSAPVSFGLSDDTLLGGDYDGDGVDDYALWRASSGGSPSLFLIRRSSATAEPPLEVSAGMDAMQQVIAASRVN